jgi:hypothetical protein
VDESTTPDTPAVTAELVQRPASAAIMTPEQFDSTWRMARALAKSGSFKDIRPGDDGATMALARIMLGADLGMSPTQALMGIDIVKGNPQIRGVALGRMVRLSARRPTPTGESYDYAVLARNFTPDAESATVALYRRGEDGTWPLVEDEQGETFDTILGPVTIRKGKRLPEAVEAFKLDQARKRNLIKSDGAWGTQPEVMVVWRALSQLVRFYAPDVIGGMPVYTEADGLRATPNLSEGQGSGEGPGWGEMDPAQLSAVQAVIARAKALGHGGYSDEPTIQQRLHGQSFSVVERWIIDALGALDEMEMTDAEPLTLTFGGETFKFDDTDDPYAAIDSALGEGKEAMIATARDLEVGAHQMDRFRPDMEDAGARLRSMAAALMREATGND